MKKMMLFLVLILLPFITFGQEELYTTLDNGEEIVLYPNSAQTGGTWEYTKKILKVIDGDTLLLKYQGEEVPFRLYFIDAPELDQPYGKEAKRHLEKILSNNPDYYIELSMETYIPYEDGQWKQIYPQKLFVKLKSNGFFNYIESMVENGLAWLYPGHAAYKRIKQLANTAQNQKIGLWSQKNPVAPWEWREQHSE